ncbi:efflux RND transporter periplasmic adaptor subunit [Verrucomicrobiales bacterium BCK34]|nr:efflux RND transporter periplasmic adaptor subunit [Verrucomicrobiales bacterium BCK34]
MKRFLKFFTGLGILAFAIGCVALLWLTKPEAGKKEDLVSLPVVEVLPVTVASETFDIPSQGIVRANRRTMLASEVAGKVEEVDALFELGSIVKKGTTLLQVEPSNYIAALAQAKSFLADAESALASEQARADQGARDWRKLGSGGEPSDLVLRKPQLASAKALVESARANQEKARLDLERTAIKAPFDAVIASTSTEVGSYLSPGATVAELFETEPYEVHLPLSVDELAFLQSDSEGNLVGEATLTATASGITRNWTGRIIRSSGEIDRATRSLHLIVEIGSPTSAGGIVMRPGLFVEAAVKGREIENVIAIPFRAFLDLNRVVTVDPDNKLRFRNVTVLHREGDTVYVTAGLSPGERVCLTELPDMVEGMSVEVKTVSADSDEPERAAEKPSTTRKP